MLGHLGRFAVALLEPRLQAPTPTGLATPSPAVNVGCNERSSNSSSESIGVIDGNVMWVSSNDLSDVLHTMHQMHALSVYDFQGREMRYTGAGDPIIASSGVTWRNGTIKLRGQSLVVKRSGVVLDTISVIGGTCGVCVVGSGSLTMTGCTVQDAVEGVSVQGSSSLHASNLRIINSKKYGFSVKGSSAASLTDCNISGAGNDGVYASHSSHLEGLRVSIDGVCGEVLCLKHSASVKLTQCALTGNPGRPGYVKHSASLKLSGCKLEGMVTTKHSGSAKVAR